MQKTANCGTPLWMEFSDLSANAFSGKQPHPGRHGLAQMLRIMRITILLLTVAFVHTYAAGKAQSVTLSGKNLSMKQVFSAIKKQTGYIVFSSEQMISDTRPVSVQATNMPLQELLDQVFALQPLDYSIKGKTIFLSRKSEPMEPGRYSDIPEPAPPISIRVTDSLGQPLAGATVSTRRKRVTGATDVNGVFNANITAGEVLTISYIGYETRTVALTASMLSSSNEIVIVLKPSGEQLEDFQLTVNTGYQRIRPEQSTGAVARITTKEYESRVSTNFLDGLVNRLPGLMINNDVTFTGNGTSRPLFNIRGISTMSANQSPLIVIDGYPTELTLDMIDPNEIQSVTILKDAAASTVYGVRASNGVIVIERKQAKAGKPRFTFRATTGITPEENYDRYRWADDASTIVSEYQKVLYGTSINSDTWNQLFMNTLQGRTAYAPVYYTMAQRAAGIITPYQEEQAFAGFRNYDNRNDYRRLFLRPAVTQTYNMNVSGGNDNALYYITANYTGNRETQVKNNNNRFILSARSTLRLSKKLSLELTTDYQEQRNNGAPIPSITGINPYERFQDENGDPTYIASGSAVSPFYNHTLMSLGLQDNMHYPLVDLNEVNDRTLTVNNRITANFRYDLGAGFDLSFGGIYETSRSDYRYYASEASSVTKQDVNSYITLNTDGTLKYNLPPGGFLRQQASRTSSYTGRAQLNYNKKIGGDHSINGILGAEIRNVVGQSNLASYFGYSDETLLQQPVDYASLVAGTIRGVYSISSPFQGSYNNYFNQQYTEDRFLSGYSNIVYSFRNTYSVTASARIDQSNLFGTNPRYKYKPLWSLGAAWNIHKERFMEDAVWVTNLKFRLAHGFNGNVAKMSLPQVIAQSTLNTYTSPFSPSLEKLSYANNSLRWEQTNNFNVGIDYAIFRNISGSIDYYRKKSTDLLGNVQIDPTIGTSPSLINQATISNNGVEFALRADWIAKRKFNWNTGLVIARNTSKVLDVFRQGDYDPRTLDLLGYVKDHPIGTLFVYRYAGLDSMGFPTVVNTKGDIYHTDNNRLGSPQTTALKSDTSGLIYSMGSSIPTINAGLSNRFDIGDFYVFCMINYYGGFKTRVPRANPSASRPLEGAGDFWRNEGDEAFTDVMALAAFRSANSNSVYNYTDSYVVNADYITLGDLTVSYSFDNAKWIRNAGFSHFEVKAQASNIWTVGLNEYNFSQATGFQKAYLTPTYTLGVFTNF